MKRTNWIARIADHISQRRKRRVGCLEAMPLTAEVLENRTLLSAISLQVDDVSATEGDDGATAFEFTVSLDAVLSEDVTFDFAVLHDTADANDFGGTFPSGNAAIPAGQLSSVITINVNGDFAFEPDETFFLDVSNASIGGRLVNLDGSLTLAQPVSEFDTVGDSFEFLPESVFVLDDRAYLTEGGRGLRILDVSDLANVRELGMIDLPGGALDVDVIGSTAYVAEGGRGLRILEVGDPTNIRELGIFDTTGAANRVTVIGNTAYVAEGSYGIRVLDVSNPAHIRELGIFDTPGNAVEVEVIGDLAYVAESAHGMRVLDVSDPANIRELGVIDLPGRPVLDLKVVDNNAYVATGSFGYDVLDVRDPENIQRRAGNGLPGSTVGVEVIGRHAYFVQSSRGVSVVDTISSTLFVEFYEMRGVTGGLFGIGETLYVTNRQLGFQAFDVNQPADIRELGALDALNDAVDVEVIGDTAYVVDTDRGLQILDVTEPTNVRGLGGFWIPEDMTDVEVVGNRAYVTETINDNFGRLRVLDASDPTDIQELGRFNTQGGALDVEVIGQTAYVANEENLRVLDVSDPTHIQQLGFLLTPESLGDVEVIGSTAYIVSDGVLRVLDVSDPTDIRELGGISSLGLARDLKVTGDTAYFLQTSDEAGVEPVTRLRVFDVSDPTNIRELGDFETFLSAIEINVSGSTAYIASGFDGIQVLDLSNAANIRELATFDTPELAKYVSVLGSTAFVADTDGGLRVLGIPLTLRARGSIVNDDFGPGSAQVNNGAIDPGAINGIYQEIVSGNFDSVPDTNGVIDDVFVWDPRSGANRIVLGYETIITNPLPPTSINGNDFTLVAIGNFDENGGSDLFFWNPRTGQNRLFWLDSDADGLTVSNAQNNTLDPLAINGNDFAEIVVGNFDGGGGDDFFFWNPRSGRNRIFHMQGAITGSLAEVANMQTNVVPQAVINGNSFEAVRTGQFQDDDLDELLFMNFVTGQNRVISFTATSPGNTSELHRVSFDRVTSTAFNGSAFDQLQIGDLNGDGVDEIFAWNTQTGANRVAILPANQVATLISNVVPPTQINGGVFQRAVTLNRDSIDDFFASEFFFWDPLRGRNRTAFLA